MNLTCVPIIATAELLTKHKFSRNLTIYVKPVFSKNPYSVGCCVRLILKTTKQINGSGLMKESKHPKFLFCQKSLNFFQQNIYGKRGEIHVFSTSSVQSFPIGLFQFFFWTFQFRSTGVFYHILCFSPVGGDFSPEKRFLQSPRFSNLDFLWTLTVPAEFVSASPWDTSIAIAMLLDCKIAMWFLLQQQYVKEVAVKIRKKKVSVGFLQASPHHC